MSGETRDPPSARPLAAVAVWLFVCAGLVLAMAVIGAITRLTESGLSMVEWKPLIGVLPPLDDDEWARVFAAYRTTPEYRLRNWGIDLAGFQRIFWWEWLHRAWGRMIGLAFLLPFVWFWARGRLARRLAPGLAGLFVLGGVQGTVGWVMVRSGLVDQPHVSPYLLAAHLLTAALVFALLIRAGLVVSGFPASGPRLPADGGAAGLRGHARLALTLVGLTMFWGALVAGLRAGYAYNTFPLMGGYWLPPEIATLTPWWLNAFENTALVQLIHRALALATAGVTLALAWRVWAGRRSRLAPALALMVGVQVGLGVATLLSVVAVPLAASHQAGAFVTLGLLVALERALGVPGPQARLTSARTGKWSEAWRLSRFLTASKPHSVSPPRT